MQQSVPSAGASRTPPDPDVANALDQFARDAIDHYRYEREGKVGKVYDAVQGKVAAVSGLDEFERRRQLRRLLDHPKLAVQVSAAIYLLKTDSRQVVPQLQKIAAMSEGTDQSDLAAMHARQALWAYEDGDLDV